MIVSAWTGGKSCYGLRVRIEDRDRHFKKSWRTVELTLGSSKTIEVRIKPSFWRRCSELVSKEIGLWLENQGLIPWQKGKPPKFSMEPIGEAKFRVRPL